MREVAERLAAAPSLRAIGEILADACERAVPFNNFGITVFEPRVSQEPFLFVRSAEFAPDWMSRKFAEILLAIERDLGGLKAALNERRAYDGFEKFPMPTIKDTELVREHWHVIRCHQQLVAPLWHGGVPVGYFAMSRSRREPRLTPADLQYFEELRVQAERGLAGIASLGPGELTPTIDLLSQAFPYPAFLFDTQGRLRWMSDEGAVRLGVVAAKLGAGRMVRGNAALEGLSRRASALAQAPGADIEAGLRSEGILRRSERLAVRRFGENGGQLLLLALTPAMAGLPDAGGAPEGSLPGLGAVESRVARLAAEGYTILNIAARLGVSEATVRTHLHRVYVKLGVHGRAELAFALLHGTG
jgi:DNA-binding CsgD family transcriptional regulator